MNKITFAVGFVCALSFSVAVTCSGYTLPGVQTVASSPASPVVALRVPISWFIAAAANSNKHIIRPRSFNERAASCRASYEARCLAEMRAKQEEEKRKVLKKISDDRAKTIG